MSRKQQADSSKDEVDWVLPLPTDCIQIVAHFLDDAFGLEKDVWPNDLITLSQVLHPEALEKYDEYLKSARAIRRPVKLTQEIPIPFDKWGVRDSKSTSDSKILDWREMTEQDKYYWAEGDTNLTDELDKRASLEALSRSMLKKDFYLTQARINYIMNIHDVRWIDDGDDDEDNITLILHLAVISQSLPIVKLVLATGCKTDQQDLLDFGNAPLHVAAQLGLKRIAQALIEAKAEVNQLSLAEMKPLSVATLFDQSDMATLLMDAKADIQGPETYYLLEPLSMAILSRGVHSNKIARELIKAKADVNSRSGAIYKISQLQLAESLHCHEIAACLLEAKAKQNPTPAASLAWATGLEVFRPVVKERTTLLHFTSGNGLVSVTQSLLQAGACANVIDELAEEDGDHLTPILQTLTHQPKHSCVIIKMLVEAKAQLNSDFSELGLDFTIPLPLHFAAHLSTEIVGGLLQHGAEVNQLGRGVFVSDAKAAPLHFAAQYGTPEVTQLLLVSRARVDIPAPYYLLPFCLEECYPLHIAAAAGRPQTVQLLVEAKADPALRTKAHETPLDLTLKKLPMDMLIKGVDFDKDYKSTIQTLLCISPTPSRGILAVEYSKFSTALLNAVAQEGAVAYADSYGRVSPISLLYGQKGLIKLYQLVVFLEPFFRKTGFILGHFDIDVSTWQIPLNPLQLIQLVSTGISLLSIPTPRGGMEPLLIPALPGTPYPQVCILPRESIPSAERLLGQYFTLFSTQPPPDSSGNRKRKPEDSADADRNPKSPKK